MSKAVLLVYSNCPAGREQEFDHWYDTIHLPDMLDTGVFTSAQRFRLSGPGPKNITRTGEEAVAQYLVIYEMNTNDTRAAMKQVSASLGRLEGRSFDGFQGVATGTYVAIAEPQFAPTASQTASSA
jgi:hypothetical protein